MSLLHKSLLAFGLLLASVLVPSGAALAANNSELQTLTRECELKNGKACSKLGSIYLNGKGVTQDYAKATEYLAKGCNLQYGLACGGLGSLYYLEKDYTKAAEYLAKGCELQYGTACGILGGRYSAGEGVPQDYAKAAEYFAKGCELQDRHACAGLGA